MGVHTILRDDPELLSGHHAKQPQPVILDTELGFPLSCRLMETGAKPWIFAKEGLEQDPRRRELEAAGISVFFAPLDSHTGFLSLENVLQTLYVDLEVRKVAVEGGVRVLESFIRSKLFDKLVVVMVPMYGVGRALFQQTRDDQDEGRGRVTREQLPDLINIRYDVLGQDLVMSAEPYFDSA